MYPQGEVKQAALYFQEQIVYYTPILEWITNYANWKNFKSY